MKNISTSSHFLLAPSARAHLPYHGIRHACNAYASWRPSIFYWYA